MSAYRDPQTSTKPSENQGWRSLWIPPLGTQGISQKKNGEIEGVRVIKDTRVAWLTASTMWVLQRLREIDVAIVEPEWVLIKSFAYMLWLLDWCIGEHPKVGVRLSLTILSVLWTFFLLSGHLTQPWCEGYVWFLAPCSVDVPGRPAFSRGEMRLEERGGGANMEN